MKLKRMFALRADVLKTKLERQPIYPKIHVRIPYETNNSSLSSPVSSQCQLNINTFHISLRMWIPEDASSNTARDSKLFVVFGCVRLILISDNRLISGYTKLHNLKDDCVPSMCLMSNLHCVPFGVLYDTFIREVWR